MTWELNPYYRPEGLGLETVAELELNQPDYSFDTVVVWRHSETGKLYWAHDSGCSCPVPFEDYTSLDTLEKLSSDDYDSLKRFVAHSYDSAERARFLRKVRDALRK